MIYLRDDSFTFGSRSIVLIQLKIEFQKKAFLSFHDVIERNVYVACELHSTDWWSPFQKLQKTKTNEHIKIINSGKS